MSGPLSILVVDDDHDNAESLGELFELEGHKVKVVNSGEDAIGAYLHNNFDIAFMDVMMPGKSGVESYQEIRRFKPDAKVFMMTGYSVEQLVAQAIKDGALGVFSKPMAPEALLGVLDSVGNSGLVVAEHKGFRSAEEVREVLLSSGKPSRIVREARMILHEQPKDEDGILICDFRRPVIEGVGVYSAVKKNGFGNAAVLLANEAGRPNDNTPLLRDYSVTGILNKPFDPVQLLDSLPALAS